MNIHIFQGHNHKPAKSQVNIVIDVIRAFTVAHYAFIRGAKEILLADSVQQAMKMKKKNPDYILAGEIQGLPIEGFDLDNSPARMSEAAVSEKTIVQKTTNGVRAALNALDAEAVFVTGFSNARKTAEYVKKICGGDSTINIIASHPDGDDDLACAEFIRSVLDGHELVTSEEVMNRIEECKAAQKFFDELQPAFNRDDIAFCKRELDEGFVMKVDNRYELPKIVRVEADE